MFPQGRTYLFDMDHNFDDDSDDTLFVIDAFHYGNVSHFFNHSCDPNLETFVGMNGFGGDIFWLAMTRSHVS